MSKKHWIEDDATRKKFWAYAKGDLGLTEDEVHQALGVKSTRDFDGDKAAAMALLQNYAAGIVPRRARAALTLQKPEHVEARVIAFCDLYTPGGTRIGLTAREGAKPDDLVATALALMDAAMSLVNIFNFGAAAQRHTPNKQPATKPPKPFDGRPTPPPAPDSGKHAPPPPPASHSHPAASALPPAGNGQARLPGRGQASGGVIQTEIIKITAPKGKPVVEFWRPNRKFREVPWSLGGEKLIAIAPTLAATGWEAAHFDAVGEEYKLAVNVHWTPSQPDGKYKDITLVELR